MRLHLHNIVGVLMLGGLLTACEAPENSEILVVAGALSATETKTADGVLGFAPDAAAGEVIVYDHLNDKEVTRVPACAKPGRGALTADEVAYVVICSGENAIKLINTASFEVTAEMPGTTRIATALDRSPPSRAVSNAVVVLGMIHDGHKTSDKYSLETLRAIIREVDPDYVLTEIPPNRLEAASQGYRDTGRVTEPRVGVFPEYVDVLFPLTREMDFQIIGVAAWNAQMNEYRRAKWREARNDPAMAHAWDEYDQAFEEFEQALQGRDDDPLFIHTDEFDEIARKAFEPHERYFNNTLGPGGWRNINEAHYRLIAKALDTHGGEGKTFLIMFGASHKYWILDQLKKRDDIRLAESFSIIEKVLADK